jgi:hypothetical protein
MLSSTNDDEIFGIQIRTAESDEAVAVRESWALVGLFIAAVVVFVVVVVFGGDDLKCVRIEVVEAGDRVSVGLVVFDVVDVVVFFGEGFFILHNTKETQNLLLLITSLTTFSRK